MSHLSQRPDIAEVGKAIEHESAALHVTGQALYTDDLIMRTKDVLHAWPVQAPHAKALIKKMDVDPAYAVPGVVRVLTAADVPGVNDAGVKHDEPLFPDEVRFFGHALCWVLGETLEAGAAGCRRSRGGLRAVAGADQRQGGDRGPRVPGGPADRRARRPRGRTRGGVPRVQRRLRVRGPGALLPRDHVRAGACRRGRPGIRAEQHPAPLRDPGDRGSRPGAAQPRGDRAVPADGWRLRRQGDAAPRLRRDRRARQHPDRAAGPAAAQPHPGPHDDRQAARLPRAVACGLR